MKIRRSFMQCILILGIFFQSTSLLFASTALENGMSVLDLSATNGQEIHFSLTVPGNTSNLSFSTSLGTGDVDLYVKFGSPPTTSSYDYRPYLNGNAETVDIIAPQAGTYYVMLRAYQSFSGVELLARYDLPPVTILENNIPYTGLVANNGSSQYFTFEVPRNATGLRFALLDTLGGAEIYIRYNAAVSKTNFDVRQRGDINFEVKAAPGTYNILVAGIGPSFYYGRVIARYTQVTPPAPVAIYNKVNVPGISAAIGHELHYYVDVPVGSKNLAFNTTGGTGDADLYVKFGAQAFIDSFDFSSKNTGNIENIAVPSVQAGRYYVVIDGKDDVNGLNLIATFDTISPYQVNRVIETIHPYDPANINGTESYRIVDLRANEIVLHFERLNLEVGDSLVLEDRNGTVVQTYQGGGDLLNISSLPIPGSVVNLKLHKNNTSSPLQPYGFTVDQYVYKPLSVVSPTLIYEEDFLAPSDSVNAIHFENENIYVNVRKSKPTTDNFFSHLTLSYFGLQILSSDSSFPGVLENISGIPSTIDGDPVHLGGNIINLEKHTVFNEFHSTINSMLTDNRGLAYLMLNNGGIRTVGIVNSRTFSGRLQSTLPTFIPVKKGTFDVSEKYLALYKENPSNVLELYDVSDPYQPQALWETAPSNLVSQPVIMGENTISMEEVSPKSYALVVYNNTTGVKQGALNLPEKILSSQWLFRVSGRILYAASSKKVYVIDVTNPVAPVILDILSMQSTDPDDRITFIHIVENRLYVIHKMLFVSGSSMETIALPQSMLGQ